MEITGKAWFINGKAERRTKKETKKNAERRKNRLFRLLTEKIGRKCPGRAEVEENLRLLGTDRDISGKLDAYYAEKLILILKILGAGLACSLLLLLTAGSGGELTEGYFLPRKEKAYTRALSLNTEDGGQTEAVIEVEPRELTDGESQALLEETVSGMEERILGDNVSLEEVRSDLNLIREIEGTPVVIEWELDNYETLNLDGSLRLENLKEEGSLTELTARLVCGGEEQIYRAVVRTFPPLLTEEEEWERSVDEAVAVSQEESRQQEMKKLPDEVDGQAVEWKEKQSSSAGGALALTVLAAVMAYLARDRDLKKQVTERDRQMQRDYARIVSKLVLLMSAGAAVRKAWEMIVKDYQMKKEKGQIKPRYAYEEMALACHEMQSGVAETKTYENFGLRCRLPCYLKLSALLEQNLRKGSKGIGQILNGEVSEAFEQRKACALSQGEEASTRLLFPMILMLAVVLLLILLPAAMSMQM